MDEPTFQQRADQALEQVRRALEGPAEEHGFEVDYNAGALAIEFEEPSPAKFVLSPNTPVRQIWVSALAKSFKLEWDEAKAAFVWRETGELLPELVARLVGRQLGTEIELG
jgi:CyaY protein